MAAIMGKAMNIAKRTSEKVKETVQDVKGTVQDKLDEMKANVAYGDVAFGLMPRAGLSPTVTEAENFDPEKDSKDLRRAMKGLFTDEKTLINILGRRTLKQRQKIAKVYQKVNERDLVEDLMNRTSSNFRALLRGMLMKPGEYDAYCLRSAMKGVGCDGRVLAEVLCMRTPAQLKVIKTQYAKQFERDLVEDVDKNTKGDSKKLLYALLTSERDEDYTEVDKNLAKSDAQALYAAGEKKWGTDVAKFVKIFTKRSFPQLRQMFEEYGKISKYDIAKSIKREMKGTLKHEFLAIIGAVRDSSQYFAGVLHDAMKGLGTNDKTLIHVVTTRAEIDLGAIKEAFQVSEGKTLAAWVKADTSGDYRKLLLTLLDAKI